MTASISFPLFFGKRGQSKPPGSSGLQVAPTKPIHSARWWLPPIHKAVMLLGRVGHSLAQLRSSKSYGSVRTKVSVSNEGCWVGYARRRDCQLRLDDVL